MLYKVIKSQQQYSEYCLMLEKLIALSSAVADIEDEIELLTLLIEKWDDDNNMFYDVDPITLLLSLMKDHGLKANDLADMLNVGNKLVTEILNYKRDLPKGMVGVLSRHFKVSKEAFDRPYPCRGGNVV